jgi:hypothetical protein
MEISQENYEESALSALLAQIAICNGSGKKIPPEVYGGLLELELQGQNIKLHIGDIQGGSVYFEYSRYVQSAEKNAIDGYAETLSVVNIRPEHPAQTYSGNFPERTGWRSARSFIGYLFMDLNRQLTKDLIRSLPGA